MVGGKTPNIVIQLVWQNKLHVVFPVLLYLKTNLFGRKWRGETSLPPKFYPVIHEYSRNFPPSCCKTILNIGDTVWRLNIAFQFILQVALFCCCQFYLHRNFNQVKV